jgi:hypothetical protein
MGPVQMLVVGFPEDRFEGEIAAELERLAEGDVIRLIDLVLARKDDTGHVTVVSVRADDSGSADAGLARKLIEAGDSDLSHLDGAEAAELWDLAETIPAGGTAAVALIEHVWTVPLREAIARAGGQALADEWVAPEDLRAIGLSPA